MKNAIIINFAKTVQLRKVFIGTRGEFTSALRKKPGIVDKLVVHFLQTFLVKK